MHMNYSPEKATSYVYQINVWHSFNWQFKLEKIYLVTKQQHP